MDTNKIRIFSGDRERFQLNGEGLFAYKSFMSDFDIFTVTEETTLEDYNFNLITNVSDKDMTLDPAQFVRFDENGLFLIAKEGAYVLNEDKTDYLIITNTWEDNDGNVHNRLDSDGELKRVSISWDGLKLRNLKGEDVFFANPNTGDLRIKGSVYADSFYVITEEEEETEVTSTIASYINNTSMTELRSELRQNTDVGARIKGYINAVATTIGGIHVRALQDAQQNNTSGDSFPTPPYKVGDLFYHTTTNKTYMCINARSTGDTNASTDDWEELVLSDAKAKMNINSEKGIISFTSEGNITFSAITRHDNSFSLDSVFSIGQSGITISSRKQIEILSDSKINITSGGELAINSGGMAYLIGSKFLIAASGTDPEAFNADNTTGSFIYGRSETIDNTPTYLLDICSDNINIKSNGSLNFSSGGTININSNDQVTIKSGNQSAIRLSGEGIELVSGKTLTIDTPRFKLNPSAVGNGAYWFVGSDIDDKYIKYTANGELIIGGRAIIEKSSNYIRNQQDGPQPFVPETDYEIGDDIYNSYPQEGTYKIRLGGNSNEWAGLYLVNNNSSIFCLSSYNRVVEINGSISSIIPVALLNATQGHIEIKANKNIELECDKLYINGNVGKTQDINIGSSTLSFKNGIFIGNSNT